MNILIIGAGYVGTTTGLVFAEMGYRVTCVDVVTEKIDVLNQGKLHFHEPGLANLLKKNLTSGRINFSTDVEEGIKENEIIFICVGTPAHSDGSANLHYIKQVAQMIGRFMNRYKVIVTKSTVPVGTSARIIQWIHLQGAAHPFDVVSNPEFLREGSAVRDALHPDRIVIGSDSQSATDRMQALYQQFDCPKVITTSTAAELMKYAANSFLAMKISYMNEIARLCDSLHVNVKDIAYGIGLDHRIGAHFLNAGIGYGGSCFPKDVTALLDTGRQQHVDLNLLKQVVQVNRTQPYYFMKKIENKLGTLANKAIALFGLSFKPYTDDTREAPSFVMINELVKKKAVVHVHDPVVSLSNDTLHRHLKQYQSPEKAANNADAVIICTEWPQYTQINWADIKEKMRGNHIFDGRNMLDEKKMKKIGFDYQGIGYSGQQCENLK